MPGVATTTSDPHGEIAARVADTPAWVFHGALDELVPPEDSRKIVAALQLRGAEVKYTEYPDLGHEVWNRAFGMPGLWTWLLAQQKRPAKSCLRPRTPSTTSLTAGPAAVVHYGIFLLANRRTNTVLKS